MRFSRSDRSHLAQWWFTVDHALLAAVLAVVATGIVLSLAASPAIAMKKGFEAYYFVERHAFFAATGVFIMLAVSLLEPRAVRRLSLAIFLGAMAGLLVVHFFGAEINGARRWLSIAGHSVQPSEFAKPAFVVLSAWLLGEARSRPDMPALAMALAMLLLFAGLLIAQPDVGQTLLIVLVWSALFFASGQPLMRALLVGTAGAGVLVVAYNVFPHVTQRVDRFFSPVAGDKSQLDRAMQSFAEGGLLGRGPGEGTIKTVLPDAHTDFIFAVVAEEYGVLACLAILALFGFIVMRCFAKAAIEPDAGVRLGILGLALLFGLQALINMGVNVGLLPAKGMTLPFISSGGSSMLAVSLTVGMALALTRVRPDPLRLKKPRLAPNIDGLGLSGQTAREEH